MPRGGDEDDGRVLEGGIGAELAAHLIATHRGITTSAGSGLVFLQRDARCPIRRDEKFETMLGREIVKRAEEEFMVVDEHKLPPPERNAPRINGAHLDRIPANTAVGKAVCVIDEVKALLVSIAARTRMDGRSLLWHTSSLSRMGHHDRGRNRARHLGIDG